MIVPLVYIRFAFLKEHSGCNVKKGLEGDKARSRKSGWNATIGMYVEGWLYRKVEHSTYLILLSCDQGESQLTWSPLRKCQIALLSHTVQKASWHYLGEKKPHFMPIRCYLPTLITNSVPISLSRSFSKWTEALLTQPFLSVFLWNVIIFLEYTKS